MKRTGPQIAEAGNDFVANYRTPAWVRPLVRHPKPTAREIVRRFDFDASADMTDDELRQGLVRGRKEDLNAHGVTSTRPLKYVVRKLPNGNAARDFILNDPDVVPLQRLADYWRVTISAVLPK